MPKKRILFIAPLPPPAGGIATWMKTLQDHGIGEDFTIDLINTALKGKRKVFEKAKFNFTEFKRNFSILAQLFFRLTFKRPHIIDYSCSLSAMGLYRDIISTLLARLFLMPIIIRFRGSAYECYSYNFRYTPKLLFKFINKIASAVVVEDSRSLALVKSFGITAKANLCPNFLSDDFFKMHSPYRNISANEDPHFKLHLLFIGGVTKKKGIPELIALAEQCPTTKFSVVGEIKADIAKFLETKTLPHNIIFYGFLTDNAVTTLLLQANIAIHPSHSEGFSLAVLEAMAQGFPIICTNVGALPDMVDEGKGGFSNISPQDIPGFKKAIDYFLEHPQALKAMGAYNYQKSYQCYRYSEVIKQIKELYYNLSYG